jgi:hypothetical protein
VKKDIEDIVEGLNSRADFIRFLDATRHDATNTLQEWENQTVPDFIEAMSAWADDCPQYYKNIGIEFDAEQPSWRLFADILLAARVYE